MKLAEPGRHACPPGHRQRGRGGEGGEGVTGGNHLWKGISLKRTWCQSARCAADRPTVASRIPALAWSVEDESASEEKLPTRWRTEFW